MRVRTQMRVSVIANRSCSLFSRDRALPKEIREAFSRMNVDTETHVVPGERIRETAERSLSDGPDALVIAGGDGSIGAVAGVLAGGNIPMGVLPCGTFNHFAQDAGIPLDLQEAVRLIREGEPRLIDLAEVNGRVFINNSSVGLYPSAVRLRDRYMKRLGGRKQIAMLISVLSIIRRFPLLTVRLVEGDREITRTTPFVFVGNNEYKVDLFNLGRRTTFTGGRLCLYTADCVRRLSIVRIAVLALINKSNREKDFHTHFLKELVLESRRRRLQVSADGEVASMKPPLRYRIRPSSLRVILPEDTSIA